jgi:hypothetical protein
MNNQEISSRSFLIIFVIFLCAIFLLTIKPLGDYDTGYHLMTGKYIVSTHSIPLYDIFSYTALGARWIAHYWLSGVLFYLVDSFFGDAGLIVFVSLVAVLTYFIILRLIVEKIGKKLLPFILLFIFSYLTLGLWVARPQIFTYLFCALLIYLLEKWRSLKIKSILYWLVPIFILWANMHAGVVVGIFILILYAFWTLIAYQERKEVIGVLFVFFAAILSTLINPNGYKLLTYLYTIAPAVSKMKVGEWMSIFYYIQRWQSKVFLIIAFLSLSFVWWAELKKRKNLNQVDWVSLGLVSASFLMPIISIRHVAFLPIFAFPFVCFYLDSLLKEKEIVLEQRSLFSFLTIILGLVLIIGPALRIPLYMHTISNILPWKVADFIKENNISGPMFNPQHYGGYFIWRLWPDYKVFIDGRSEIYFGTPNNDYDTIFFQKDGWEDLLNNKYKINFIIVPYSELGSSFGSFISNRINKIGFVCVYYDDNALIFVRDSSKNKEIIDRFKCDIANPFSDLKSIPKEKLLEAYKQAKTNLLNSKNASVSRYIAEFLEIRLKQEKIPILDLNN